MYTLKRTDEEIDEQMNLAEEELVAEGSKWPGMSYEQGVHQALGWVTGQMDDAPMSEE